MLQRTYGPRRSSRGPASTRPRGSKIAQACPIVLQLFRWLLSGYWCLTFAGTTVASREQVAKDTGGENGQHDN